MDLWSFSPGQFALASERKGVMQAVASQYSSYKPESDPALSQIVFVN
jgi:hypothetical protein